MIKIRGWIRLRIGIVLTPIWILIWIGIGMEIGILIGTKAMTIHNTALIVLLR